MKWLQMGLVVCLFGGCWGLVAAEDSQSREIHMEAAVVSFAKADEGYVLLLVEDAGDSWAQALERVQNKVESFRELAAKEFPEARLQVISGKVGWEGFDRLELRSGPARPGICKVLLFTIPPDETLALRLLKAGFEAKLATFREFSAFGMVYYGRRDVDDALRTLYAEAVRKLRAEAEMLAEPPDTGLLLREIPQAWLADSWNIDFHGIPIYFPTQFISKNPEQIVLALFLGGNLEPDKETANVN